jgi:hypothetical protein
MKPVIIIVLLISPLFSTAQHKYASKASQNLFDEINSNNDLVFSEAMERLLAAYNLQLVQNDNENNLREESKFYSSKKYSPATSYFIETPVNKRNQIRSSIRNTLNHDYESAVPKMVSNEHNFWEDVYTLFDEQKMSGIALTQEARTAGDPHLRTLDGLNYDFQTVGEFVLCKSEKRNFEVQVRQKAVNAYVSLNSAVALNVHGQRVVFTANDGSPSNNVNLRINCQPVQINDQFLVFQNGGAIEKIGNEVYKVYWETGEFVTIRISDYIDLGLSIPRALNRSTAGLLGNNNGDPNDDLQTLQGQFISINQFGNDLITAQSKNILNSDLSAQQQLTHSQIASTIGRSWRVSDSSSLFCYAPGTNTATFTQNDFPEKYRSIYDLTPSEFEEAKRICQESGIDQENLNACIYDVGFTKQEKFVQSGIFFQNIRQKESILSTNNPTYIAPESNPNQSNQSILSSPVDKKPTPTQRIKVKKGN